MPCFLFFYSLIQDSPLANLHLDPLLYLSFVSIMNVLFGSSHMCYDISRVKVFFAGVKVVVIEKKEEHKAMFACTRHCMVSSDQCIVFYMKKER